MNAYLLSWNPDVWSWPNLQNNIKTFKQNGELLHSWSTGKRRHLPVGSRVFLIRLGVEPKGIIGSGWTVSEPYIDDERRYVRFVFDTLHDKPLLPLEELKKISKFHWSIQGSGVEIPAKTVSVLENTWKDKQGMRLPPVIEETSNPKHYPEGAVVKTTVNAYERNPAARRDCIAHYGTACIVCGFEFGEFYGSSMADYIQVHHLIPLSSLGKQYRVNPVHDLRPVCPNCHAVIHSTQPPLSIYEVKKLVSRRKKNI